MSKTPPRSTDPILALVLKQIHNLSAAQIQSNSSNLVSASTIRSWRKGKVKRPVNYTLDAALAAAGYERYIRRIKK